jgi:hypothetical protein
VVNKELKASWETEKLEHAKAKLQKQNGWKSMSGTPAMEK